ncbi:MAG: type II secretion system protein GspF, partial [Moraxellaceae bacterium]
MGAFNYQALDANGKTVKGVIEGDSDKQVRALLRQRQLRPLEVQATQQRVPMGTVKSKRFGFGGGVQA